MIFLDHSDEFWPQAGWMQWFCALLAVLDTSLIGFLVYQVMK